MFKSVRFLVANCARWVRVQYLRALGVQIGRNTMISLKAFVDTHRGKVIIGDNCHITLGSIILAHDGAARQLGIDDGCGIVKIGNGVFVGANSIILRDVEIGDNVVIGAGSVVTADVPANAVVGGNPAKVLRFIDSHSKQVLFKK